MDLGRPFRFAEISAPLRRAWEKTRSPGAGRLLRFCLTGLLTTATAYVVFVGLIALGVHYLIANVFAWGVALLVGFVVNRRFTFGITGADGRSRHFGLYLLGAGLQLMLGSVGYAILIGYLRLDPTPAFAVNIIITATFNYLFLSLVTFRPAAAKR